MCMSAASTFKRWQSYKAGVKLCIWVCLSMTQLCLKQQTLYFHGLEQVGFHFKPLLCFTHALLSEYEHSGAAVETYCRFSQV